MTHLDLDLEDIDATQLDLELNEPPEPEPPVSAPAPAPAPAQAQNQNQNQYNYGQQPAANNGGGYDQNQNAGGNNHGASGSGGQPSFGGYGGGNEGGDRIKPNEMPDEGLVARFFFFYLPLYYFYLRDSVMVVEFSQPIFDSDSSTKALRKPSNSLGSLDTVATTITIIPDNPHIAPGRPYKETVTDPMYYVPSTHSTRSTPFILHLPSPNIFKHTLTKLPWLS